MANESEPQKPPPPRRPVGFLGLLIAAAFVCAAIYASRPPQQACGSARAKYTAAVQSLRTLKIALGVYEAQAGKFPSTQEGLDALIHRPSSIGEQFWRGPFLEEIPRDVWHRDFIYLSPGAHDPDFDLISMGPDGRPGTEDDITSWDPATDLNK